jgi:4-carboxymuconolactone decarboxylase
MSPNHELLQLHTSETASGDAATMLGKLEPSGSNLTILRYLANASTLLPHFVRFSNALLNKSTLPRPLIEVVILRIATRLAVPYEWAEHVIMAERAGVPADVIDAIARDDLPAAGLDDDTLLAVRAADALVDGDPVAADDWRACHDTFGAEGATELLLLVGWFAGLVRTVLIGLELEAPK